MSFGQNQICTNVIRQLRSKEEVMLYNNILSVTDEDMSAVLDFLDGEFQTELLNFPPGAPPFDRDAAAWAAKTVYLSAQLILYRENNPDDLGSILPPYVSAITPAAIVSADLMLRFLPAMILQLKQIDHEDPLVGILERYLGCWHYSGISYDLDISTLDFQIITADEFMKTLYCSRIIEERKLSLAKHPVFVDSVRASLGIYGKELWKEFSEISSEVLYDKH